MADIVLAGLSKRFGRVRSLSDVSLSLGNGELMAVLGASGAGKTTLLRVVAGLDAVDAGHITISGRAVTRLPPGERRVGLVFRNNALFPAASLRDNLAFPLRSPAHRLAEPEIRARVEAIARQVGLASDLDCPAAELPVADERRAAIARTLIRWPAVCLLDDPFQHLDAGARIELRALLRRLQAETGVTAIHATADPEEALAIADRIAVLHRGRVLQVGAPRDVYDHPRSVAVASSLGESTFNLLAPGLVDEGQTPGGTRTIGARPEHLAVTRAPGRRKSNGTVQRAEHTGHADRLQVLLDGGSRIVASAAPGQGIAGGDRVMVRLRGGLYFDAAGNRITSRR